MTDATETPAPKKRLALAIGAGLAVLAAGALVALLVFGGQTPKAVAKDVKRIAPEGTSSLLVTPASEDWLTVIEMWVDPSTPVGLLGVPDDSSWLAVSTSKTATEPGEGAAAATAAAESIFHTVYVGFEDARAAERFARRTPEAALVVQENIAMLTSGHTSVAYEKFPEEIVAITGAPEKATWSMDLTEDTASIVDRSPFRGSYATAMKHLGVSADPGKATRWYGEAKTLREGFTGKIENLGKVDLAKVAEEFVKTQAVTCNSRESAGLLQSECSTEVDGLAATGYSAYLHTEDFQIAGVGSPNTVLKHEDFEFSGNVDPRHWRAVALGTLGAPSPLGTFEFGIKGDTMRLVPVLAKRQ